jgi:hypothetical protein
MIAIGLLFVRMLCDCFKPRQQLQAKILVLRHQLNVLDVAELRTVAGDVGMDILGLPLSDEEVRQIIAEAEVS